MKYKIQTNQRVVIEAVSKQSNEQFLELDVVSQLHCLLSLAKTAEQRWDEKQSRRQILDEIVTKLSLLDGSQDQKVRHLVRLKPLLSQDIELGQFFSFIVPLERGLQEFCGGRKLQIDKLDGQTGAGADMPLVLVFDNIRSAFNVGSMIRTAETLGVQKIYLCGYTATPENPRVVKAAMGAERKVAWQWCGRSIELLAKLKNDGVCCYGLETVRGAANLYETEFSHNSALIVGNEHFGLSSELLAECDGIVRIPVFGQKNSLNVAAALGICGYEIRRRWGLSS